MAVVDRADDSALAEVRDAIDAAMISLREPDEDGPRCAVISSSLRGAFIYSRSEAERRIRLAWPELSERGVARAVRALENRVILAIRPRAQAERKRSGWVHGWGWNDHEAGGFRR